MTQLLTSSHVAPKDKFTTIYSGMDVQPFLDSSRHRTATRHELGYGNQVIVVGKVARLFHLKGHRYVIDAAQRIVQKCPNVRFLFVGDGVLHKELNQRIQDAGLTDYFKFLGLVPRDRIPALISAMDIVVHASLREGLARALPQALIAGKPVVSFDVDGAREVVLPESTGLLVGPQNTRELVAAIKRLAQDANLRERFGKKGRQLFADKFRHQVMTREIREVYARILNAV